MPVGKSRWFYLDAPADQVGGKDRIGENPARILSSHNQVQ